MDKWEYKQYNTLSYNEKLIHELNDLGKDGWELISTINLQSAVKYIFKRKIK